MKIGSVEHVITKMSEEEPVRKVAMKRLRQKLITSYFVEFLHVIKFSSFYNDYVFDSSCFCKKSVTRQSLYYKWLVSDSSCFCKKSVIGSSKLRVTAMRPERVYCNRHPKEFRLSYNPVMSGVNPASNTVL